MFKYVRTSDCRFDEATSSLIKVARSGIDRDWMEKRAGVESPLHREFSQLTPDPKYAWVHTLAIGSHDRYGYNRNGDGWTAAELRSSHPTFLKFAHVYELHQNKDPKKAIGILKASAFNEEMSRVELIYGLDSTNPRAVPYIQKLARGEDQEGSMGCHVDFDVCGIRGCHKHAASPKEYCKHAKDHMCQILEDGQICGVMNPNSRFFDWSKVPRHADRIAFDTNFLAPGTKAAGAFSTSRMFSADLAKYAGLWIPAELAARDGKQRYAAKVALAGKLAEMEKEVATTFSPIDTKIKDSHVEEGLKDADVDVLKKTGLPGAMAALHNAQIVLPVRDFLKLISDGDVDSGIADEVQGALPGVFGRMAEDGEDLDADAFDGEGPGDGPLSGMLRGILPSLGMGEGPLGRRLTITVISGPKKTASSPKEVVPEVESLARLYGMYKLSALSHHRNVSDVVLTRAALLQNYLHL